MASVRTCDAQWQEYIPLPLVTPENRGVTGPGAWAGGQLRGGGEVDRTAHRSGTENWKIEGQPMRHISSAQLGTTETRKHV